MAQVAQDTALQARIDGFLAYALDEWAAVPAYARAFPGWEASQQLDFVHEWAMRESAVEVLQEYASSRALTPEQHTRYQRLLALVAEQRPTIERLLAS